MAPADAMNTESFSCLSVEKRPYPKPLKSSGALAKFTCEDMTPVIGREFPTVNIVEDILNAVNSNELIRDLAIDISRRGVVFFRAQDNLTDKLQKEFIHRLGQLSGKPLDSTLHIHPVLNNTSEFGVFDAEISPVSSVQRKALFELAPPPTKRRYDYFSQWHSDIQYEPVPADYTSLRLTQLPKTGGDTLWASGYELYDRFSKPYQKFFEGLTATCVADGFLKYAAAFPDLVKIYEQPRGSPANVGGSLSAVHPIVRTNPVTGWKSIFAFGPFTKKINELEQQESDELLKKFGQMIVENHDLQVRFKWRNKNDLAIWDNRSVFHCATYDYDQEPGERVGTRAVGIGEAPYFDPESVSRSEELFGTVE